MDVVCGVQVAWAAIDWSDFWFIFIALMLIVGTWEWILMEEKKRR
jgi:hypothetical protein